jgi:hypothetical protein
MLDWVGSLRIRENSEQRVSLTLTRSTRIAGWVLAGLGTWLTLAAWAVSVWLAVLPAVLTVFGLLLASLRRELTFDRDGGVLRVDQSALGLSSRTVVPLFHLRAVVILARDEEMPGWRRLGPRRYVAYIERRVGEAIYLDESRRCAKLLRMAEAIAELAELRLEYDATAVS